LNTDVSPFLKARLQRLGIFEQDLDEQFVRSGGHGGQNVNKVSTCVILKHRPSGLMIRCDEERSQAQNRALARKRLADRIEAIEQARLAKERHAVEKIRRQKRKRSKAAKERMLQTKHHRSLIKKGRRAFGRDDQ